MFFLILVFFTAISSVLFVFPLQNETNFYVHKKENY